MELTTEDDFLHDTVQSATRVIAQSGMLTGETSADAATAPLRTGRVGNLLPI